MASQSYNKQVNLLLSVLPEIAKETTLALHGGTAINLFVREMPRLSVDIDLTYIPFDDRQTSLKNISEALDRCKDRIRKVVSTSNIQQNDGETKMVVSDHGTVVKIEVNNVNRGALSKPVKMNLCAKAQNKYDVFCSINVVSMGQLFGGKIVAAFDRQHPRDIFDMKYLLDNEGFSDDIKTGFLLLLICSDRPVHEVLFPIFQDQRSALENQFSGMTDEDFSYEDYEKVRAMIVDTVHKSLNNSDKEFLLSVKGLKPDWSKYNFEKFPAVQWKLQNLQKLKDVTPAKYQLMYEDLERMLSEL